MRRPDFFILGAPKCGTTSLAAWLADHPKVFVSAVKEPHFFNTDGLRSITSSREFDALWVDVDDAAVAVGEASTHYLYSQEAVPRILAYNPRARFVVCVRNPVDMAPALHAERVWQGRETIRSFARAWALQDARRDGRHIPRTMRQDPERLQYGAYCKVGEQIARLYSYVPRHRVCVVVLEDMAADPKREYDRVVSFLGAQTDHRVEFPVHNRRKAVRSVWIAFGARTLRDFQRTVGMTRGLGLARRIRKLNSRPAQRASLSAAMRAELADYFRDDVETLGALLGRNLARQWLSPPPVMRGATDGRPVVEPRP